MPAVKLSFHISMILGVHRIAPETTPLNISLTNRIDIFAIELVS